MVRYFAYCTLLDVAEMRRFVPEANPTVTATLEGYRVRFAGYGSGGGCDLESDPGHLIQAWSMNSATSKPLSSTTSLVWGRVPTVA